MYCGPVPTIIYKLIPNYRRCDMIDFYNVVAVMMINQYKVSGDDIKVIDMPLLYTHNIENTGKKKLTTVFWINEIFNKQDADTYGEKV